MATLTIQSITEAGATPTYAAVAAGGDVVDNRKGDTVLAVVNGSGGNLTVTITAQNTTADNSSYGALTKANASFIIANGATGMIGPFRANAFNNGSDQIAIGYSTDTSVTIACLTFRNP
jgi:hypothetical protein